MTVDEIMKELESKGSDSTKRILLKHGILEPFFGAKVEDMKSIQKRVKKDYALSKALYATGNTDAMYLSGLIADETAMSKKDLNEWVKLAQSPNISEYTVPWIAAESKHGWDLALEWIDKESEHIAAAGWACLSSWVAIRPDNELDTDALKQLLKRVQNSIHQEKNRVRSAMNGFVIAVGTYVSPLHEAALLAAKAMGPVTIIKEGTACKVPDAGIYILKAKEKGKIGAKKKMARC